MKESDQLATSFITPFGMYCYVTMPFGLRNAGAVAEPPKLSRLKCAGHHHKGNTDSNALQTEQFLVCRNVPIQPPDLGSNKHTPHEGESRDITTIHILQHRHSIYYIKFKVFNTDPNLVKHYTRHKFKFRVTQWKENTTTTTRRKRGPS